MLKISPSITVFIIIWLPITSRSEKAYVESTANSFDTSDSRFGNIELKLIPDAEQNVSVSNDPDLPPEKVKSNLHAANDSGSSSNIDASETSSSNVIVKHEADFAVIFPGTNLIIKVGTDLNPAGTSSGSPVSHQESKLLSDKVETESRTGNNGQDVPIAKTTSYQAPVSGSEVAVEQSLSILHTDHGISEVSRKQESSVVHREHELSEVNVKQEASAVHREQEFSELGVQHDTSVVHREHAFSEVGVNAEASVVHREHGISELNVKHESSVVHREHESSELSVDDAAQVSPEKGKEWSLSIIKLKSNSSMNSAQWHDLAMNEDHRDAEEDQEVRYFLKFNPPEEFYISLFGYRDRNQCPQRMNCYVYLLMNKPNANERLTNVLLKYVKPGVVNPLDEEHGELWQIKRACENVRCGEIDATDEL